MIVSIDTGPNLSSRKRRGMRSLGLFLKAIESEVDKNSLLKSDVRVEIIKEKVEKLYRMVHNANLTKELLAQAFLRANNAEKIILARRLQDASGVSGIVEYVQNELTEPSEVDIEALLNPSPKKASELYADRDDKSESVVEFIDRVYGEVGHLTGYFGRVHLRKLDPKCAHALTNWEVRNGRAEILLPTKSELTDIMATPGIFEKLPAKMRYRVTAARAKRQQISHEPSAE